MSKANRKKKPSESMPAPVSQATGRTEDIESLMLTNIHRMLLGEAVTDMQAAGVTAALSHRGQEVRKQASRANMLGIQVATARHMNLSGRALIPLWKEIAGTDPEPFMPIEGERSNGDAPALMGNQQVIAAPAGA